MGAIVLSLKKARICHTTVLMKVVAARWMMTTMKMTAIIKVMSLTHIAFVGVEEAGAEVRQRLGQRQREGQSAGKRRRGGWQGLRRN